VKAVMTFQGAAQYLYGGTEKDHKYLKVG